MSGNASEKPMTMPVAPRLEVGTPLLDGSDGGLASEEAFLIRFTDVGYAPDGAADPILSEVSFDVREGDRLFVLGGRKTGKSVLIRLITGELTPTSGEIIRRGRMSFPLGQLPFYVPHAPLEAYIKHVAKSYGGDSDEVWTYFESLALAVYDSSRPIGQLMAKDRQMLSIILGLLIPFDLYVLDDHSPFLGQSNEIASILEQRSRTGSFIFSTRMAHGIRNHATRIAVLSGGYISMFDTFLDGLRAFRKATASTTSASSSF